MFPKLFGYLMFPMHFLYAGFVFWLYSLWSAPAPPISMLMVSAAILFFRVSCFQWKQFGKSQVIGSKYVQHTWAIGALMLLADVTLGVEARVVSERPSEGTKEIEQGHRNHHRSKCWGRHCEKANAPAETFPMLGKNVQCVCRRVSLVDLIIWIPGAPRLRFAKFLCNSDT